MNWLSQSAEVLIGLCIKSSSEGGEDTNEATHAAVDVAVVGSGYGGAVAALRFAEHGQSVYVLERGDEYVSGDFPNDLSQIGKHVRSEIATASGVTAQGYESALFDFRIGLRAGALIGNGLGGGSLINAGVGLRPDERVFKQEEWPAALRQEMDLSQWFAKASRMHELQTPGRSPLGFTQPLDIFKTKKYQRMQEIAGLAEARKNKTPNSTGTQVKFEPAPIAVQLNDPAPQELGPREPCIGCGDCVTGCNNKAKLSLTSTYLPQAFKAGAELFTGLTVLYVSYDKAGSEEHPWVVHFIRTADRQLQHEIEQRHRGVNGHASSTAIKDWIYTLRARRVVLGAGAFGSTEIMLRSRDKGLSLSSTALGIGISGNGDDVSLAYDMKQEANAIGHGSRDGTQMAVGPTISSFIRFTDPVDVKKESLIQDGGIPGLMRGVVHELFTSLGVLAQMGNLRFRKYETHDWLALDPKVLERCLTLLGMGHDTAGGVMAFDHKNDRMGWGWPKAEKETTPLLHKGRQKRPIEEMGGLYIQNPAVNALPDSMSSVLSGPKAGGGLFTVHPLGGCRMSDMALTGVVNHWGEAWRSDGELHDGLYVMDGSTIPSSLGANPMLTITALAERACAMILGGIPRGETTTRGLLKYPECITPLKVAASVHSSARVSEVLRGAMAVQWTVEKKAALTALEALTQNRPSVSAALFMEFNVENWQRLFDCPSHKIVIRDSSGGGDAYTLPRLVLEAPLSDRGGGSVGEPVVLTVTDGTVNFFCVRNDGWCASTNQWLRTAMTYWAYRWGPDISRSWSLKKFTIRRIFETIQDFFRDPRKFIRAQIERFKKLANYISGAVKLIGHASEVREFRYELHLIDKEMNTYSLTGKKTVQAAATKQSLEIWRKSKGWQAAHRRSLWQQISEVEMTLFAGRSPSKTKSKLTANPDANLDLAAGLPLLSPSESRPKPLTVISTGRLSMDIPDMLRRVMPSIGLQRDSLSALLELAGYPLFLMRAMLKMRLLDFKLPYYHEDKEHKPDLPDTDPAAIAKPAGYFELNSVAYPDLPPNLKDPMPEPIKASDPILLEVPLTWPKSAAEGFEMIRLGLVRYPQKGSPSVKVDGGVRRVKSIVLLNGFDLSAKPFVAQELNEIDGGNLATQLHHEGWDVWLLEYRASPLLDASALFSNMDDIAAFDIPAAVKYIIKTVSGEIGEPEKENQTQIFAFTHCVGSASMAMSMLSGYLVHADTGFEQLAGVLFSQYHPFVVGSATAQTRLQFAAFLHNVLKLDTLQFTAGTVKANLIYSMIDRLFSSAYYARKGEKVPYLHEAHNQACPSDDDLRLKRPESTTCKRMTGLLSRLFEHDQLLPKTHEKLADYFGRSNMGVYLHGAKCVEYEKLVNADGQNVYIKDAAIKTHMNLPIMLLHGEKNVLFDMESWDRTLTQFVRVLNPDDAPNVALQLDVATGRNLTVRSGNIRALRVAGHAHFDCVVGKNAPAQIFPEVTKFFDEAFSESPLAYEGHLRCRARLPLTGPIIGWVRTTPANKKLVRVWIEVDNAHAGEAVAALTVLRVAGNTKVQAWPIKVEKMLSLANARNTNFNLANQSVVMPSALVKFAVADIEWPGGDVVGTLEMVGIHCYQGPKFELETNKKFPPGWGTPLTLAELRGLPKAPNPPHIQVTTDAFPKDRASVVSAPSDLVFTKTAVVGELLGSPFDLGLTALEQGVSSPSVSPSIPPPIQPKSTAVTDASQIQPLDIAPELLNESDFLPLLKVDIANANQTAMAAEPGTLSRTRRNRRSYEQRVITLKPAQLQTLKTDKLIFFAGACRHPGLTAFEYERADATLSEAVKKIDSSSPQFMLMLGDQIYADVRAGVLDTESPIEKLLPRYRGAFGSSQSFRALASRLPMYMVMDDHEINDDWSRDQERASAASQVLARNAITAFKVFQYSHGPGAPVDPAKPAESVKGFNYSYTCGGLPFLVLDTRSQRTRTPEPRLLHASQWKWLEAWLMEEQEKGAHPKFVISGSVVAPGLTKYGGYPANRNADSWQMSSLERKRLLSFISDNNIDNVVFISSDYHCSAAATITFTKSKVKAWAIVAPPIHAPMRFANSEANTVLSNEPIVLGCGVAHVDSQAWDGDGWLEFNSVKRRDPTTVYEITLRFNIRRLELNDWPSEPKICQWTLQT